MRRVHGRGSNRNSVGRSSHTPRKAILDMGWIMDGRVEADGSFRRRKGKGNQGSLTYGATPRFTDLYRPPCASRRFHPSPPTEETDELLHGAARLHLFRTNRLSARASLNLASVTFRQLYEYQKMDHRGCVSLNLHSKFICAVLAHRTDRLPAICVFMVLSPPHPIPIHRVTLCHCVVRFCSEFILSDRAGHTRSNFPGHVKSIYRSLREQRGNPD
jgi:hypothetical protein